MILRRVIEIERARLGVGATTKVAQVRFAQEDSNQKSVGIANGSPGWIPVFHPLALMLPPTRANQHRDLYLDHTQFAFLSAPKEMRIFA